VSFNDAYKEWRNRTRPYNSESVVRAALQFLSDAPDDPLEDLRRAPWQVLLLVKWVCQDKLVRKRTGRPITGEELGNLRQELWRLPERLDLDASDIRPIRLTFRQLMNPQIGFQRPASKGFLREAAILDLQPKDNSVRQLFESKTGLGIADFMDLAFATYAAILGGQLRFDTNWFKPFHPNYSVDVIEKFLSCISRTFDQLVEFCCNLPGANRKVASELHEFPVISRYPFLRSGGRLECWHPAVFFRGMEGIVHSILSEEGQIYIDRFSKLFEAHVLREAKALPATFFGETGLRAFISAESKVTDGLLSFPNCNILIESKAGLFDESVMSIGHMEMFVRKSRALESAIKQAWSMYESLHCERRAPPRILDAQKNYLLIVTNRELSASRGSALAAMYPPGTLSPSNTEVGQRLPLEHIYVLSIQDFERLVAGTCNGDIELPSFLATCVQNDDNAGTSVHFFEQHLEAQNVPRQFSDLVNNALDQVASRIEQTLQSS